MLDVLKCGIGKVKERFGPGSLEMEVVWLQGETHGDGKEDIILWQGWVSLWGLKLVKDDGGSCTNKVAFKRCVNCDVFVFQGLRGDG